MQYPEQLHKYPPQEQMNLNYLPSDYSNVRSISKQGVEPFIPATIKESLPSSTYIT